MVKPVVRPIFAASARCNFLAFPPFFARLLAYSETAAENDCTLPKQARYQLRYIPKILLYYTILFPCCQERVVQFPSAGGLGIYPERIDNRVKP